MADPMFPKRQTQESLLVDIKVLITVFCFGMTGFAALYNRRVNKSIDPAVAMSEVMASITQAALCCPPIMHLSRIGSQRHDPVDMFQTALFTAGYILQASRDD
jgi:hypothetical protein